VLSFHAGLQTNQARHGLVEIDDAALLIHHQYAVFNRVEQRFEEPALARSRWTTVCRPSASSRPMRPSTLSRKLDLGAGIE